MALYEFKCRACGTRYHFPDRDHVGDPCVCGATIRRVFSFSFRLSMPEHFNHSTGTYVTNTATLNDEFKRLSDEATEYTGIEHNYKPVDWRDKETFGVTEEGLDATYDRAKQEGRPTLDPDSV